MEKCIKCGKSPFETMLHRTNPKGQVNAGWMCMPCIEKNETELSKNLKEEKDYNVVQDIEKSILNKK